MNKILLALAILGAGTAGSLTARHSTMRLQREASATRESWVVQTQVLAAAQGERARLAERIRELKQSLRQAEAAGNQNGLWSVLETNRIGHLAPDLREHLLEELGFNWNSSEAFVVVSKESLRDIHMYAFWQGKLTDSAVGALALTPRELSQIEAAMERVKKDLKDWAISHTERSEPRDDVLAQYTLQSGSPTSISNNFTEVFSAIGKERTELMWHQYEGGIPRWIDEGGWGGGERTTMILKRFSGGDNQVLKAQVFTSGGRKVQEADAAPWNKISTRNFRRPFLPLFPTGWADVAQQEGFELPEESQEK